MKVYRHLDEFSPIENLVLTIGTFDGVHLGHQKIINRISQIANEIDGQALLLSFFPHPRTVLDPNAGNLRLINTLGEKIKLLDRFGLQQMIIHPFDIAFSELSSETFIREVIVEKLQAKKVVIGYNHHFGKGREGGFEQLLSFSKTHDFGVEEISAEDIQNIHISSTKIREALSNGEIKKANEYLGYNYFLSGIVIEGDQIGRKIQFPTANIFIEEKYKLIPKNGVYAVRVKIDNKTFNGMLNIGQRPTIPGREFSVEVNIFDFNGDIYGAIIEVELIDRLRDERKFDGLEALEEQLKKDRILAKQILI